MKQLKNFSSFLINSALDGVNSFVAVNSSALNKELRRKTTNSTSSHLETLVNKTRGRSKSKGPYSRGKSQINCRSRKNIECFHYSKKGYIKKHY